MRFMASMRMSGRIIGSYKGSDAAVSETLLKDVLALMVRISNTQIDPQDPLIRASHLQRWLAYDSLADNTRALIRYWRDAGVAGRIPPSSLLARGTSWLLANAPEDEASLRLIHGDVGFHNILFDGERLSALLDWENARFGDPAEELSLFITASESHASREQLLRWYREAGGADVSEYRLRYFEVFHCIKVVIAALVSLQRIDEHPEGNLNLGVFGLQYLHFVGAALNTLIARAESARNSKRI
jgi:hypothetical protein